MMKNEVNEELWKMSRQLNEIQKDLMEIRAMLRDAGLWGSGPRVPDFLRRDTERRIRNGKQC